MDRSISTCQNCGKDFVGKYCSHCGEKIYRDEDKKISHFFHETIHFITHLDSKFFKTGWVILSQPGRLSKDYCEGKRKKYYKPVSFFLICIILYLLFPLVQGMNLPFKTHLTNFRDLGIDFPRSWALNIMRHRRVNEQLLAQRFDHLSPQISKGLLLLLIPMTALVLALLFKNKRRYFFDHFVLATEFNIFYLVFIFFFIPLAARLLAALFNLDLNNNDALSVLIPGLLIVFGVLFVAFKRFYLTGAAEGVLKTILFFPGYFVVIFLYRIILFSSVMIAL